MKAVYDAIYGRQSVFKADSISVDLQISECMKLADDPALVKVYQDRGYTGANTNRPAFQAMMKDIKAGLIKRVIVWKLDRISRSVADFALMVNTFGEYGVFFRSFTEPELTLSDSGYGKALLEIIMIFAELERDNIQMRVRENYYSRLALGMVGGGPAPFGYKREPISVNGKKSFMYVPDPETADTVIDLFRRYAEDGVSLGQLVKHLNASGIKTQRGKFWNVSNLSRLMRNPAYTQANADLYVYLQSKGVQFTNEAEDYIGASSVYVYGKRKSDKYSDMEGDYASLAPHQGLIDTDTFLKVQARMAQNKAFANSGKGSYSWLAGISKCGYCKKAIVFHPNGKKIPYINCIGRHDKHCYERKRSIKASTVEAEVEKELLAYLATLPIKTEIASKRVEPKKNELTLKLEKLDQQISNYLDKLELADGATLSHINERIKALDKERKIIAAKLTKLTVDTLTPSKDSVDIDALIKEWPTLSLEEKKIIARTYIKRVTIWDDEISVQFVGGKEDDDEQENIKREVA